jgi:glycosyltransferase involved in cell wall biosynthesis
MKVMIDNGVRVPMVVSGCGVDHWEGITASTDFHLSARKFRFLHVSSCFPRKGADVLLDAFGHCFSIEDDVSLIIKTFPNPHNEIHRWLRLRQDQNAKFPHVTIIEDNLSDADLKSLYHQCDVLVAPSRAEGFCLPIAEALLSGIPVIATAWSGVLDFCNRQSAWLVDYDFARPQTHFGLFYSAWAEPRVTDLEEKLQSAYRSTPGERKSMARVGRDFLLREFTWMDCVSRTVNAAQVWMEKGGEAQSAKIGWVSTWNIKCGIATYSKHLTSNMPSSVIVYAAQNEEILGTDNQNCIRSWSTGKEKNNLRNVAALIRQADVNTVVIQFNYGFFNFSELSNFIRGEVKEGRVIVVMLHSTNDPYGHTPNWQLAELKEALSLCHRLLVHSVHDMNQLKSMGLVENVCLFPHGVLGEDLVQHRPPAFDETLPPLVATYGFCLPNKGLKEIVHAAALLKAQGYPIRLRLVNAEYPDPISTQLVAEIRELVKSLSLFQLVEFYNEFLEDEESLALLSDANLIVFPYQITGESASGAVRYGLATKRPVAVTPMNIFEDLGNAVFYFHGRTPASIAEGVRRVLSEVESNSELARNTRVAADRWRKVHSYRSIGNRLYNLCLALLHNRNLFSREFAGSSRDFRSEVGLVQGRWLKSNGTAGYLLLGPYLRLSAGGYRIRIRGQAKTLGAPSAYVDIAVHDGHFVLPSTVPSNSSDSDCLAEIEVALGEAVNDLEIRVWVGEGSNIAIWKVEIQRLWCMFNDGRCNQTMAASPSVLRTAAPLQSSISKRTLSL